MQLRKVFAICGLKFSGTSNYKRTKAVVLNNYLNVHFCKSSSSGCHTTSSGMMVISVVVRDAVARDDVPEANGAERDEAKVAAVQESPPLPLAEENRATTDVGDLSSISQIELYFVL